MNYDEKVAEFIHLINTNPNDVELLKAEFEQLTGYEWDDSLEGKL